MQLLPCSLFVALQSLFLAATAFALPYPFSGSHSGKVRVCLHRAIAESRSSPSSSSQPLPLIIWHGLGDSFDNEGLKSVAELANATVPNTPVYLIRLAGDGSGDRYATFFGNLTEQVLSVCDTLASHPILSAAPAVNALGFSQGGQFLRAYVQRCNNPPVHNLITFGSQHNGISQFQACKAGDWLCFAAEGMLRGGTWASFVQSRLVPAQYFRDPEALEPYLEHSNFLADINNERDLKNETYKANLSKLNKFAMYMFEKDKTVIPKESAWFAEYNKTSRLVTKLQDREIYKEDWLGLKALDKKGALDFRLVEGAEHMHLSEEVLVEAFKTYYAPVAKKREEPKLHSAPEELLAVQSEL